MEPLGLDRMLCQLSGASEASGQPWGGGSKGLQDWGRGELGLMSRRKGSPKSGGEGFRLGRGASQFPPLRLHQLTVYLGKRDFVDHLDRVDPVGKQVSHVRRAPGGFLGKTGGQLGTERAPAVFSSPEKGAVFRWCCSCISRVDREIPEVGWGEMQNFF